VVCSLPKRDIFRIAILPLIVLVTSCEDKGVDTSTYPMNWPSVSIITSPDTTKINVDVLFTAEAEDSNPASNERGLVIGFDWDFGDGTIHGDTTSSIGHTYVVEGQFVTSVTAHDDDGNMASDSVAVVVTKGRIPSADAGGPYEVKFNTELALEGSGFDSDGEIVLFEWDFDADGVYDWSSADASVTAHVFTEDGTYIVALQVTDNDANTGVDSAVVVVHRGSYPIANAGGPYTVKLGSVLELVGSGSDADGTVIRYEWDFDGDGQFDWSSETAEVVAYSPAAVGAYPTILRVTDNDGNSSGDTAWVVVVLHDLATLQPNSTLTGHMDAVYAVVVTSHGDRIVSGSLDGTVKLWSMADGALESTLAGSMTSVTSVAVSSDGQHIVSGGSDSLGQGSLEVWNLDDGSLVRTLPVADDEGHLSNVRSVALSPDGQYIVSGELLGTIKIWRLSDGELVRTVEGHTRTLRSLAVSLDGQYIVSAGVDDNVGGGAPIIKVWRFPDGILIRTMETSSPRGVSISPDSRYIACGHNDYTVRVWRLSDGVLVGTLLGNTGIPMAPTFSPDGQYIISGGADHTVKVWRFFDGTLLRTLAGHSGYVFSVAVSPDGRHIVSGSNDGTIEIWTAQD
jgi:WD40 repeat protein